MSRFAFLMQAAKRGRFAYPRHDPEVMYVQEAVDKVSGVGNRIIRIAGEKVYFSTGSSDLALQIS